MEAERWQQLRRLFDAVCELPSAQWSQRLGELSDDPALIEEALSLLAAQTASFNRALQPLGELMATLPASELQAGDRLGAWQLVERLASGGMGTVFVAERVDQLFRQRVAIKLLRGTVAGPAVAERLASERQILAELQHPGIARLYDGGTTPAGQPYLVMEYVDGLPLDRYCAQHALDLRGRLRLFLRICGAVQAAHQQLVVHCDLKPSNVLVRGASEPVLLDFGIARMMGDGGDVDAAGFCTPAYASPELLAGAYVGVAGDVFSLGVLLTELLVGKRIDRALTDFAQPVPLASALAGQGARRRLSGDLDAIAGKACALEPAQRYPSVEALALDIERYLARRPVAARAASVRYRLGRFVQRHWRESAMAALLLVLSTVFVWRLVVERARAEHEAVVAGQVSDFLVEAFSVDNTTGRDAADPAEISAREVLDRGVARVDAELTDAPAMQARLRLVLGRAYRGLGAPEQAERLLRQAADGYQDRQVGRPLEAAEALGDLSVLMGNQMRGDDAVAVARQAMSLREEFGAEPESLADSYNMLGLALLRKADLQQARRALEKSLALRRELFGSTAMQTSVALHNLGLLYRETGDNAKAEAYYRQALAIRRKHNRRSDAVQSSLQGLAVTLAAQARHAEATALLRENLELAQALYGIDSDKVAKARMRLAMALQERGDYMLAREHLLQAMAASERLSGEDSLDYGQVLNAYAALLAVRGDWVTAEQTYRRALAIRVMRLPDDDRAVLRTREYLGGVLMRLRRMPEARAIFEDTWLQWRRKYENEDPRLPEFLDARLRRSEWLSWQGETDAAEASLPASFEGQPAMDLRARVLRAELAQRRRDWNEAVALWRGVIAMSTSHTAADAASTAQWRVPYAEALAATGDRPAADEQLRLAEQPLHREMVAGAEVLQRLGALKMTLAAAAGEDRD
jgi:serine/threonine-protein kinase